MRIKVGTLVPLLYCAPVSSHDSLFDTSVTLYTFESNGLSWAVDTKEGL